MQGLPRTSVPDASSAGRDKPRMQVKYQGGMPPRPPLHPRTSAETVTESGPSSMMTIRVKGRAAGPLSTAPSCANSLAWHGHRKIVAPAPTQLDTPGESNDLPG